MAIVIFSGIDRPSHFSLLAAERASGMVNAKQALQPALRQAYLQWPQVTLTLDSGAFQGEQDVARYAAVIEQIGSRFLWVSNLDVLWNQRVSNKHFDYLQAHVSPLLRQKILWVFQPGGSLSELEQMAQQRQLIGIGGVVWLLKQQGLEAVSRYLVRIGDRLLGVHAQAHVFGIASATMLFRLRTAPWLASVDSSKWLVAYRARSVLRTSGTGACQAASLGLCLTPTEMAANNIRIMQFWLSTPSAQLSLFEEDDPMITESEDQCMIQMVVYLRGSSSDLAFYEHFAPWLMSWDGGEDDEVFYRLRPAPISLGKELVAWCQAALRSGQLADYEMWSEEEEHIAA